MLLAWLTTAILAAPAGPPADGLEPVTVAVVDGETGGPVASLRYQVSYKAPDRPAPDDRVWTPVESPAGTFVVRAPKSCKLLLTVKGRDHLGGKGMYHEFLIRSGDGPRRVVVKLTPGITARGTVRDAATGAPIAGAKVVPLFMGSGVRITEDDEWAVVTDGEGRYELHGIDPEWGVSASHPDYTWDKDDAKKWRPKFDFLLPPGEVVRGTVRGTDGKPLEGVVVEDWKHRRVETGRDGAFALKNGWDLKFRKDGYITRRLSGKDEVVREGLVVVMEPLFALEGQVVSPDGRPIETFTVEAGPNRLPRGYDCIKREVKDRSGRFAVGLGQAGLHWAGVRAEGHAAWEGWVEVVRDCKPLAIRLEPGVTASGRVVAPARWEGAIRATLVPRRDKTGFGGLSGEEAEQFASRETTVGSDGALRFEHLRPDRYFLRLDGPAITPITLALDIPAEGLALGSIRVPGRGRVVGRVFRPGEEEQGKPWEFAPGIVLSPALDWRREIEFRSGEDGRFAVEGVPAGMVRVGFQFHVFDVIGAHVWTTQVVEGQTTEVHAFEPGRERPLAIQFDVGDGTDAQFVSGSGRDAKRLVENVTKMGSIFLDDREKAAKKDVPRPPMFFPELRSHSRGPFSSSEPEWDEPDAQRRIVLPDIAPGAYRLRILDWLGSTELTDGVLFDEDITVSTGKPIRIPLGAGCITGKCPKNDGYHRPVVVVATPRDGKGPSRRSRCDGEGNFCVRYLTPGHYTLRALDPAIGWTRVDDVAVGVGATDVGELRLKPGGTLAGSIAFRRPSPVPDVVVATDETGTALTSRYEVYSSFDGFEFRGLWPGRWTVAARSGGATVVTGDVTLVGTESARVDVATGAGNGP